MSISAQNYGLAFHTTTPQLAIALANFKGDHRSQIWDLGRNLSSCFHQHLQEFLSPQTLQDIAFIAVAKGPGGFTGTRIGVVAARTFGQQLDIPVYGVSTLAAIAHNTIQIKDNSLIAVEMNARREQLFVAIYQVSSNGIWSEYLADTTTTKSKWHETLAALQSPYQLIKAPDEVAYSIDSVLSLGYIQWQQKIYSQWSEIVPFYGQHPV